MRSIAVVIICLLTASCGCSKSRKKSGEWKVQGKTRVLPKPDRENGPPLMKVIQQRRSVRHFKPDRLTEDQIAQLCWAAQGITATDTRARAAPSAGALYPITVLLADADGVFEYRPESHSLVERVNRDVRKQLKSAALGQSPVGAAPACLIITMDVATTASKYGKEAKRYCLLEVGHVAQNILLTAVSLDLGAVPIGGFHGDQVAKMIGLPDRLEVVYLIPVGRTGD